ncbi:calmodulin-like protein containing EF hand domain [Diplonema papillatum]|nr:calmodulin-like protein containing EF hand domain [Diplonema papillatum]
MEDFVLDVAADLYGTKENLEVKFSERPTLAMLKSKAESLFQIEATVQRPPGEPLQHVRVRRFQVYNDYSRRWQDLESSSQLQPYAQLYCFQESSADYQGEIPQPSPPRSRIVVPAASPQRSYRSPSDGHNSTLQDLRDDVNRSPRARQRLQEEDQDYRGSPMVSGESLLAAERAQEEEKMQMDVDSHRERIRRETHDFLVNGGSPSRSR